MSKIIPAAETAVTVAYTEALQLHHQIMAHGSTAATAFVEMCRCLKRMRDAQLYKELQFDTFDDYVEQMVGIKQRQAYKYIMIYERYGDTALNKHAGLGITKLELIASLPATEREDFIENNDVEDLSVREIQRLTEELKSKGEQLSLLQTEFDDLKAAVSADSDADDYNSEALEEMLRSMERENQELCERISELEKENPDPPPLDDAAIIKIRKDAEKAAKAAAKADIQKEKDAATQREAKIKADADAKLKKLQDEKAAAEKQAEEASRREEASFARAKKIEAELKLKSSAVTTEFTVHFGNVQDGINKIIGKIEEAGNENPEMGKKLATAMLRFLDSAIDMIEGLTVQEGNS